MAEKPEGNPFEEMLGYDFGGVDYRAALESDDPPKLEPEPEPLTDAAKEQIKLRATFVNGIAIATFSVGVLAPVVTATTRDDISGGVIGTLIVLAIVCFIISAVLHSHAYRHLKELDR